MTHDQDAPVDETAGPVVGAKRAELDMLHVGAEFGVYRIRECIGIGGMGVVYRAEHTLIERTVALKVLGPPEGTDPSMVRRFFAEARAVNRASHPNIVQVTDLVYHGGRHGLVMEYLEGGSLAAAIDRNGFIPVERLVGIALQTTRGLAAAHRAGVLHLDLTPTNVFLSPHATGELVKVLDFGLTNLGAPPATLRRYVFGTPHYMAPELASATRYDARADIYALGAVLFEALTGRVMFQGTTPREVLMAHITETPRFPPADQRLQAVPEWLEELVLRCLEKDPIDRPQSMDELADIFGTMAHPRPALTRAVESPGGALAGASGGESAPDVHRPRARVRTLRRAALALGAAAAATLVYTATQPVVSARGSEASSSQPLAAVTLSAPAPAEPIRMRIGSDPSGAEIWHDGELVAMTPATLELAPTGRAATLQVRLPGFHDVQYEAALQGDGALHFVLQARAREPEAPVHPARVPPARDERDSTIARRVTE
jgi:serine/threonine-protein kinase